MSFSMGLKNLEPKPIIFNHNFAVILEPDFDCSQLFDVPEF